MIFKIILNKFPVSQYSMKYSKIEHGIISKLKIISSNNEDNYCSP